MEQNRANSVPQTYSPGTGAESQAKKKKLNTGSAERSTAAMSSSTSSSCHGEKSERTTSGSKEMEPNKSDSQHSGTYEQTDRSEPSSSVSTTTMKTTDKNTTTCAGSSAGSGAGASVGSGDVAGGSDIDEASTSQHGSVDTEVRAGTSGIGKTSRRSKHASRNYRTQVRSQALSSSDSDDATNIGAVLRTVKRKRDRQRTESQPVDDDSNSPAEEENGSTNRLAASYVAEPYSSSSSGSGFLFNNIYDNDTEENTAGSSDEPDEAGIQKIANVLSIAKPKHNWCSIRELHYREIGLSGKGRRNAFSGLGPQRFQNRVSGSLHAVERLELMYKLEKHEGCVNTINFNHAGNLLVSGSDDLNIILWKWASKEILTSFESGHTANVFQAKFVDLCNGINIITSAKDGQVRHSAIHPGDGKHSSKVLVQHMGAVHKIALPPTNPFEVLSAGEDGHVIRIDLRENKVQREISVKSRNRAVALYSIAAHPIAPEFCVCGKDQFVRVFDRRNTKRCVKMLCPDKFLTKKPFVTHITCAVYNYIGTEILASYSEDDIYLFDNVSYTEGAYKHKYQGHNNASTIKGVNFFGPQSEFVMSGSDCGNCFFWDRETEAIVQWMPGDENGVVNCLEGHPAFPMLATSGLDNDIKIWVPSHETTPEMAGLRKCVLRNIASENFILETEHNFDNQIMSIILRECFHTRPQRNVDNRDFPSVADMLSENSDNNDSSDDESAMMDDRRSGRLTCNPS